MDADLMRKFLIVLASMKQRGGEIKIGIDSLDAVDDNARISFNRDGPLMVMSFEVVKDRWGRVIDRCGQVKCLDCSVRVNYSYSDGTKRERCSDHDGLGSRR